MEKRFPAGMEGRISLRLIMISSEPASPFAGAPLLLGTAPLLSPEHIGCGPRTVNG
jgi:hypothetical protein